MTIDGKAPYAFCLFLYEVTCFFFFEKNRSFPCLRRMRSCGHFSIIDIPSFLLAVPLFLLLSNLIGRRVMFEVCKIKEFAICVIIQAATRSL